MTSIFGNPNVLLRLEGLGVFALALAVYAHLASGWGLFWATVLLPDLAMLGYLAGPRVGALAYNTTHAKLLPSALALAGLATGHGLFVSLALIWFAHIGVDRMLGYGLKYPEGFRFTHLGLIGQASNAVGRLMPCHR